MTADERPCVHLVDATFELFRAYFSHPSLRAPDGREVGAVRGVMMTLAFLLRDEGATHVACATDHVVRSFRNDLFAGYKTEEGVDPALLDQFPIVERAMRAMGLVVWPMVELEADDGLASGAARFADAARQVILATPDKDLAQCVRGDHVVMVDRMRKKTLDEDGVRAKFGVSPASIPDWLALVGDDSDGYPGLPGWGARSAATVVDAHGTIEAIPDDPTDWKARPRGADKLAATLRERRDEALLYKKLATLRLDAPIRETLDDLRWRGPTDDLPRLCAELGIQGVRERLPGQDRRA
ncbi:MAG: flap endonuclease [Deltaproteobacteria bacterium]|nr:flap endonuclease [Deltaproteobacteria bacterium]